ncbi:hypothetical protein phiAS5_ORF0289 [Aeromonas phage phiAS5]|uniref:Uncharacterized protein n=1 Tax=Aeromonas phage phiAS5 TaxID=879630 RepID=E1A243_9CAUD|nr:hypothetical protein phiAS5_ORF0289 [Aeromonas phage phiAS5]ADM80132.1 hypothetical protein phiAS5_ORF0289 [Aeromonas phage phiAS5]BES53106.1 hypothetical protein [Aeromonas phage phiWae14]
MFIKKEDSQLILNTVEGLKNNWNGIVDKFENKSNKRALTVKWTFVKVDIEDMTMEVKFETGWNDDFAVCCIDVNIDGVEVSDIIKDIETEIAKHLEHHVKRDAEYVERMNRAKEIEKKQRFEQYKQLKAEFGE